MKRICLIAAVISLFGLNACSQTADKKTEEKKEMKTLVAYFSASGVTRGVAQTLAEVTGGDLHEIRPAQAYTDADLDWTNKKSRSSVEMADKASRPEITDRLPNLDAYDTVYVGFPIWWYTCPTIINTFMESYDFNGKTVIPFATSGGSTIDKACADLKASYPDVNWKQGRLLNRATKADIEKWVATL